jgi:LemA protein
VTGSQVVLIGLGAAGFVALAWLALIYNRFVGIRQHLRESWTNIDVELKRRHDLIPSLVRVVQAVASHERTVFESVAAARAGACRPHDDLASRRADENALADAAGRLLAVAERYPELRANAQFAELHRELVVTEDRLAAARRFYNGNVRELNQLCGMFPTSLVAAAFGFREAEYFEVATASERAAPPVVLSGAGDPPNR